MLSSTRDKIISIIDSYSSRCGGPFDYSFDREEAIYRMNNFFGDCMKHVIECTCDDKANCPYSNDTYTILSGFMLIQRFHRLLVPQKSLFDGLKDMKYEELEIMESAYNSSQKSYPCNEFNKFIKMHYGRQRIRYTTKGNNDAPKIPKLFAEIVEGVELSDEMLSTVKSVLFTFNGFPAVKVQCDGKKFVKCPFIIPIIYLVYTNVGVTFLDENDKDLGYDFDSWLIGGMVDYDQLEMKDVVVPYMHNGKECEVLFKSGVAIFKIV